MDRAKLLEECLLKIDQVASKLPYSPESNEIIRIIMVEAGIIRPGIFDEMITIEPKREAEYERRIAG